jgi:hypothetical protein
VAPRAAEGRDDFESAWSGDRDDAADRSTSAEIVRRRVEAVVHAINGLEGLIERAITRGYERREERRNLDIHYTVTKQIAVKQESEKQSR